ncbi:MAG: alkaline phosphatase family protein [Chloroflexota bacterium]
MISERKKVVVLGLDGASWNILNPLIGEGKLPTFKKLLQEGSYGDLRSIMPPVSVPAWKCYSTGKNPGKLGVYNLLSLDLKNRKLTAPSSRDFKEKEIWDYLADEGSTSCVYNMFATHPAKEMKGCLISDIPNERGYYPKELQKEIESRFGSLYIEPNFIMDREETYAKSLWGMRRDFEVIMYLMEKYNPDFTHLSIPYTDGIQHFFWGDMETKNGRFAQNIEKAWVELDEIVANFCDFLQKKYADNFYLFVMSDHGFEGVKHRFNIGDWLVRKRYLVLNKKGKFLRFSFFLRKQMSVVYSAVETINSFLRGFVGKKEQRRGVQGMLVTAAVYEKTIDWNKSAVIPLTGECLYVNKKTAGAGFTEKLIDELRGLKSPEDNPLVVEIVNGKEFYSNNSAPDVLILPRNIEIYNAPLMRISWSQPDPTRWTGKHSLQGVLIMRGPGIKKGHQIKSATLYDIAPTVLHLMGISLPDSDGNVLEGALVNGS